MVQQEDPFLSSTTAMVLPLALSPAAASSVAAAWGLLLSAGAADATLTGAVLAGALEAGAAEAGAAEALAG